MRKIMQNLFGFPESKPLRSWDMPMLIGEFGINANAPYAEEWVNDTTTVFEEYGLGWIWWAYWKSDAPNTSALLYANGTERTQFTKYLKSHTQK
jgi:hypothetical protein